MIKNQSGFSLLHGLVIVLVVVLVAGAGWFVWDRNNTEEDNQKQQKTANQIDAASKDLMDGKPWREEKKPVENTTEVKDGFLVVKDWNVRFQPGLALKADNIIVTEVIHYPDQAVETYSFTTKAAAAIEGCASSSQASLTRSKTNISLWEKEGSKPIKLGGYVYYVGRANGSCAMSASISEQQQQDLAVARNGIGDGLELLEAN